VPADYKNEIVITAEEKKRGIFKTPNGKGKFLRGLRLVTPVCPYRISEQKAKTEEQ
jgi:hypothetical protein